MDSDDTYERSKDPTKCFVPFCGNNNVKNSNLVFFTMRKELKERWCKMLNRNCPKRRLYCCQNHINLEEDIENYNKWLNGARPKLRLDADLINIPKGSKVEMKENKPVSQQRPRKIDKSIMAKPTMKDKTTNFRSRKKKEKVMPSLFSQKQNEESESVSQSPSKFGTSNFDSTSSNPVQEFKQQIGRQQRLKIIKEKPKMYLGLPKTYWWLIEHIAEQCSTIALYIIVTLFKIKNNDTFLRMSDEFELARVTIKNIFEKNVAILASYFQNFIYLPSTEEIKRNLPLVFKIRYSNVTCIIDCFEIEIERPSNPVKQAQTWSQYKSCNTVKYLIGCTPGGLICFVSKGFGGRISDKAITKISGFIDILLPNAVIMADRGFKELEELLFTKNAKILRPPSVHKNKPMTKKEVIETKVIASLRIHIERIIRRVREFHMLKPHSVVNHNHVRYLDEIVIIACGLINLQEPIIKDY